MGGAGKGLHGPGVILVDLGAFQDLEGRGTVFKPDHERSSSGLSLVPDHSADTDRAVELGAEQGHAGRRRGGKGHLGAEFPV